jgi:predicted DNA-binding protein (UPF0251 family)
MRELETIALGLDELEAMRLCDLEDHDQEAAGARMRVSRGTVQRLLQSGRAKIVRALMESAALVIESDPEREVATDRREAAAPLRRPREFG